MIKVRNENYFEKKLEMSIGKLGMAKRKLEHFDIQMENLIVRFEHDKKVYNDQTKHMQEIVVDMEKRIPKLEKKLKQGYTHFDNRTGKAYKSFEAIHIDQLETLRLETIERQKAFAEKARKRQELKDIKDRSSLTEEDQELIVAIELQADMQTADEIKANQEKQLEDIQRKREFYEEELEKLSAGVKEPSATDIKFDAVGNEIRKEPKGKIVIHDYTQGEDLPEPEITMEELEIALEEDLEKEVIPHIDIVKTPNDEISKLRSISQQIGEHKDEINGMVKEMDWLLTKHQDWIDSYDLEEGGKAIHAGRIVNGFRKWCEEKGYKIGD